MKLERFYQLQELMTQAFQQKEFQHAKVLAEEYLDLANSNKTNWNYGNAIHQANLMLGKISLRKRKIEEAKIFLLKAGRTPGSPQLKNFGPHMRIAKELLEIGEFEIVLEYLGLCRIFWRKIFSWYKIRKWKKIIRNGGIPNFKAHLNY